MIVSTKRPRRDVSWATRVGDRPRGETRQEHEDPYKCVCIRYTGTFVQQPRVQMSEHHRPSSADNYKVREDQDSIKDVHHNFHSVVAEDFSQAIRRRIGKRNLNEMGDFAVMGIGEYAIIDDEQTPNDI